MAERCIYADDFLDLFYVASAGQDKMFVKVVEQVVEDVPTADVVEVRHSYWQCSNVRMSSRDITCRYCHRTETISNVTEDFEYCPHCGAKMDGKDGE